MVQALTFASDFKLGHYMKSMQIGSYKLIPISDFFSKLLPGPCFGVKYVFKCILISLIDVEVKLGCGHYSRWNSAARCSSLDVHQYPVIQSPVHCYSTSDVYNSDMCSPTQKDG